MTYLRHCTVLDHGEEALVSAGKCHDVAITVIVLPPRGVLHGVAEPDLSFGKKNDRIILGSSIFRHNHERTNCQKAFRKSLNICFIKEVFFSVELLTKCKLSTMKSRI